MARIVYPDGTEQPVFPRKGGTFELKDLQRLVGGYIELVSRHSVRGLPPDTQCLVNEEGITLGLDPNPRASQLVGNDHQIVGPMVILQGKERMK